jgi:hypothetical protein
MSGWAAGFSLRDVLTKIVARRPMSGIDELAFVSSESVTDGAAA